MSTNPNLPLLKRDMDGLRKLLALKEKAGYQWGPEDDIALLGQAKRVSEGAGKLARALALPKPA